MLKIIINNIILKNIKMLEFKLIILIVLIMMESFQNVNTLSLSIKNKHLSNGRLVKCLMFFNILKINFSFQIFKEKFKIDHYNNVNSHLNLTHHLTLNDININYNETSLITRFESIYKYIRSLYL